MHQPPNPQSNKQSLKGWWKQFTVKQAKKDSDELAKNIPHTVFGTPLRESLRYASVKISTANSAGELFVWGYIPVVIAKCCLFLKENATEVERIFGTDGSSGRVRELQAIFESPPRYGKDLNWKSGSYTSYDVASVFRRYLAQLPEPVIPTEQFHDFRAALAKQPRDETDIIQVYRKLIRDMPRANQYLLLYVLDMFSVFARKSDKNQMTESNLAVIFRPGIISHPSHEMKPSEYTLSQEVLVFLIQHQDHFMLDPPRPADSVMLTSEGAPGLGPSSRDMFSPAATERLGDIVPSDSDEDPPIGGWKLVERRQDPTTGSSGTTATAGTLITEHESISSDPLVSARVEGGDKVKRSRTAPSQRGPSALESKQRIKRLDTLSSVGRMTEAGILEKDPPHSTGVERVIGDNDEDPPPDVWEPAERRRDPRAAKATRRRPSNDQTANTLTTGSNSYGFDSSASGLVEDWANVKRPRNTSSTREPSTPDSKRHVMWLDTLGSAESIAEAAIEKVRVVKEGPEWEEDPPAPTLTAIFNLVPPSDKLS